MTAKCGNGAGRTDVHDAGGQGRKRVDQAIRENRRFTISVLSDSFPDISRSALYTIVSERHHYRKLCARWVPKMLSDHHKTQRMGAALTLSPAAAFYDKGIGKLVPRYDKCLSRSGDYVEK